MNIVFKIVLLYIFNDFFHVKAQQNEQMNLLDIKISETGKNKTSFPISINRLLFKIFRSEQEFRDVQTRKSWSAQESSEFKILSLILACTFYDELPTFLGRKANLWMYSSRFFWNLFEKAWWICIRFFYKVLCSFARVMRTSTFQFECRTKIFKLHRKDW